MSITQPDLADRLPSASDIERTAEQIAPVIGPTPLQHDRRLSELTGYDVWLKREDLTAVRSYKVRGAYAMISALTEDERARGVTCASAGNHAQGVAYACAAAKVPATIFLPRTTPRQKRDRVASLGGDMVTVIISGQSYDEAAAAASAYAHTSGATIIPAFDHPKIIAGQGTVAVELLQQTASRGLQPAAVVVPVGGGGLLAGMSTVFAARAPRTGILAAEPQGAASLALAMEAGEPSTLESMDLFVDGAAVRRIGRWTHEAIVAAEQTVEIDPVAVPEGLICVEMLDLYQTDGIIAEPAGALASAGLRWRTGGQLPAGSTVVCVLSGGNNDVSRYGDILERALIFEGLRHYFLVEFMQKPGALRGFLDSVLGPDDDIVHFEYTKRNNRETGPALVGIDLARAADIDSLLDRIAQGNVRAERIDPDSPLFGFLR